HHLTGPGRPPAADQVEVLGGQVAPVEVDVAGPVVTGDVDLEERPGDHAPRPGPRAEQRLDAGVVQLWGDLPVVRVAHLDLHLGCAVGVLGVGERDDAGGQAGGER